MEFVIRRTRVQRAVKQLQLQTTVCPVFMSLHPRLILIPLKIPHSQDVSSDPYNCITQYTNARAQNENLKSLRITISYGLPGI